MRDDELGITEAVKPYLRAAHDHAFQTLDAIETYRDRVVGLMDRYWSRSSLRLDEVMRSLTIVAAIFIPPTFLSGVHGMYFEYMPELHTRWAYPAVWGVVISTAGVLLQWFRVGDGSERSPSSRMIQSVWAVPALSADAASRGDRVTRWAD
jgi:magnesium transporter